MPCRRAAPCRSPCPAPPRHGSRCSIASALGASVSSPPTPCVTRTMASRSRSSEPSPSRRCARSSPARPRGTPCTARSTDRETSFGGLMTTLDLAEHRGEWVEPLSARYRDVDVLELPPNTQGVAVLEALRILDELGPLPPDGLDRQHRLIEVTKLALADRDAHVTDPEHMRIDPAQLLSTSWVRERAALFDPTRAREPGRVRSIDSGTAYLCAADRGGMLVSLIQSNFLGFGSGLTVPKWGINLHDRGATFSLHDGHPNVVAPRKRTLHTLIPALALRDGAPWLAFGTMGGHGQAQTHVQRLARVVDDRDDVQSAISAPRWLVDLNDWSVTAEDRFTAEVFDGLAERGHRVARVPAFAQSMGHAHAIEVVPGGFASATDPRA